MEQRETTIIDTVHAHRVELHTYVTGRERQYISEPFLKATEINVQNGQMGAVNGAVITEANNRAIEKIVVSLDGSKDNVFDRIMDLPEADFNEITAAINEVTEGKKKEPSTETPS